MAILVAETRTGAIKAYVGSPDFFDNSHDSIGQNVYWYLDDQYIGTIEGDHKMTVKFNEGWNTLKIIEVNGSEDIQKVFAVINN